MNITEKAVARLARELNLDKDRSDIIRYGLQSLLYTTLSAVFVLAVSAMLGIVKESATVLLAVMITRKVSGGAHSRTLSGCIFLGTATTVTLGLTASLFAPRLTGYPLAVFGVALPAFISAWYFAPADVPEKPIRSHRQRAALRRLTFAVLAVWVMAGFVFYNWWKPALVYIATGNLGILWQMFLITPMGYRFIAFFDRFPR